MLLSQEQGQSRTFCFECLSCCFDSCRSKKLTGSIKITPSLGPHLRFNISSSKILASTLLAQQSPTFKHFIIPIQLRFGNSLLTSTAMIDSGATGNFMNSSFASTIPLQLRKKSIPQNLYVIDGTLISSGQLTHNTPDIKLLI